MTDQFLNDIRASVRGVRKNPKLGLLAILTLAIGIGANSTVFSWINATLLHPIPGASQAEKLVAVTLGDSGDFSYPDYLDLKSVVDSLSGLAAFSIRPADLTGSGKPERIWVTLVSGNYFDVLGVAVQGRTFAPEEVSTQGSVPVAVISYRLWQQAFGGAADILGRTIHINQHPYAVIGIAAREFQGSETGVRSDLWLPLTMQEQIVSGGDRLGRRDESWLMLIGRLRANSSQEHARTELNLLMRRIVEQYPEAHQGPAEAVVHPLWSSPNGANAYFRPLLIMLAMIAGLVLLLSCVSVANLLLVNVIAREREFAIRLALGIGRWRMVRQLMLESAVLALAGGSIALLLTIFTSRLFQLFLPPTQLPISVAPEVSAPVFVATFALSVLTVLVFGLLPAARCARLSPMAVMKENTNHSTGGGRRTRLLSGLVMCQVALSSFLLVCSGLLVRSFREAQAATVGFDQDHVLLESFDLFPAGYSSTRGIAFDRELLSRLRALPNVQEATLANWVPLGLRSSSAIILPSGYVPQPHESMDLSDAIVGPGYLKTMRISLVAGRDFSWSDDENSQWVAIVNQTFVDRYWPKQDAVGRQLQMEGKGYTVVGVAANSDYDSLAQRPKPFVYLPLLQRYYHGAIVHLRTSGDPMALADPVERTIHELNAGLPVFDITTLRSQVQTANTGRRIAGTLVGTFGILALLLAAVGLYGVVAYKTELRTREIGIRMALGASILAILRLVMGQGLRLAATGLCIGLLFAILLTRYLRSFLFGVSATDWFTLLGTITALGLIALFATAVPGRKATRVAPSVALKTE
jgi:predicted permease